MAFKLSKRFRFEAAHFLPEVPEGHQCRRLHGHSYRVEISVRGDLDPRAGWFLDYGHLSRVVRSVLGDLDHNLLNSVAGLENPTAETLSIWIWDRLEPQLSGLYRVTVMETCQTRCSYRGPKRASRGSPREG